MTGIEARLIVLEEQVAKLDRLVDKLFQRLPKAEASANGGDHIA
ncbi:MAG: hypothetical protein ACJ789_10925 [Thermomicrobiales bacterium]